MQPEMTTSSRSFRVLLVEDELMIRSIVAEALHDEGLEVIEAEDGAQAVGLINGPDGFDLLLTDVQMPGPINGIQVATHARRRHPDIPVIVVSAQPRNACHLGGLGMRAIFIRKPYRLSALVAALRSVLPIEDHATPVPS